MTHQNGHRSASSQPAAGSVNGQHASNPALPAIRRQVAWMGGLAVILVFGIGGWAFSTELTGAVIAPGQLVVNSYVKKVQHPTGGVVAQIFAREGDFVKQGDLLVRLDETQTKANLAIITKNIDELASRQAREEAERDGANEIAFPADLVARRNESSVEKILSGELSQWRVRRASRDGQRSQLQERIAQLRQEIVGYQSQVEAKVSQIEWIQKELEGVNDLWSKNLVPYTRVATLEREKQRLLGEQGQLIATIAQTKGKIAETEVQVIQIDQEMRAEVGKDLADIRARLAELGERKVAAEDQLQRMDIRAPQDGVVHESTVHTVGGVITAQGTPLMLIVPETDALEVEARIQPQDIDQLYIGQQTALRLPAFNQRTTPELNGTLKLIAADVSKDQKTGVEYYSIRISIPASEIARLGKLKLLPGMPVEAFIQTNPRTVISYITRPLRDQLARAFREE